MHRFTQLSGSGGCHYETEHGISILAFFRRLGRPSETVGFRVKEPPDWIRRMLRKVHCAAGPARLGDTPSTTAAEGRRSARDSGHVRAYSWRRASIGSM